MDWLLSAGVVLQKPDSEKNPDPFLRSLLAKKSAGFFLKRRLQQEAAARSLKSRALLNEQCEPLFCHGGLCRDGFQKATRGVKLIGAGRRLDSGSPGSLRRNLDSG